MDDPYIDNTTERSMDEQTRKALELAREAIQDGLSVCQSVCMDRSRRVMRDDCVFYLQTEEWCKWVEDEIGALMGPALAAIDAALSAPAAPVAQPLSERDNHVSAFLGRGAGIVRRLFNDAPNVSDANDAGDWMQYAAQLLAAAPAAPVAPAGWVLVPVEPTLAMRQAGVGWGTASSTWEHMLAAAPAAPAPVAQPLTDEQIERAHGIGQGGAA